MANFKKLLFVVLLLALASCASSDRLHIALSKGSGSESYLRYGKWLKEIDKDVKTYDMTALGLEKALKKLETCNGLVLTGGEDVHPSRYGKGYDTARCKINLERDTLEFALISRALELNIPIFAICRGEQILNVALGGTLIVDIPDDYPTELSHACKDRFSNCHLVEVVPNTYLSEIVKIERDSVNSSHHQAVEYLGEGLIANVYSSDGLIEGFEWQDRERKPFIMAVQWHPERMPREHPLSWAIARKFLEYAREYKAEKIPIK